MRLAQKDAWGDVLDEDVVEKLMELRTYLENRLKEIEEESERLRVLAKLVEEVLVSRSFRVAETLQPTPPSEGEAPSPAADLEESVPLTTAYGVSLAALVVTPPTVRIIPVEELEFRLQTPPFQSFFVARILETMRAKDEDAARKGEVLPEDALSYDIVTEGDVIKEVVVKNYGGETRLREIKSACRWTLEKMYERTHGG
jgi:hypothetical protein